MFLGPRKAPKPQASQPATVPAPVGGWNARDPISAMPPTDAVSMDNWFPSTSDVRTRDGWEQHATGIPDPVLTLMVWNGPTGSKMFGATATEIYDVTAAGAVGAAELSGLTSGQWSWSNFGTGAGNFIIATNGLDGCHKYDGSTWTTNAITGPTTPSDLVTVTNFKQRLYFVEKNTLSAWYLAAGTIAGAATEFDLSTIFKYGGALANIATWSIDSGAGLDDHIVFITTEGEVAIYQGDNPSSATDWALIGVYRIGQPVGRNCWFKYAGDVLIICRDGVFPLSSALQSDRVNAAVAVTDKIRNAMRQAVELYGDNYGWILEFYSGQSMLILNVPKGDTSDQYVMNTLTGSWCRFTDMPASYWVIFENEPYFAGDTYVGKALGAVNDNGSNIYCSFLQAYSYFGFDTQIKKVEGVRPTYGLSGNATIEACLSVDYREQVPYQLNSAAIGEAAEWDVSNWDEGLWGGEQIVSGWQLIGGGIGYAFALRMNATVNNAEVKYLASSYLIQQGGIL